jgi:HK97 family phage major capsid protein
MEKKELLVELEAMKTDLLAKVEKDGKEAVKNFEEKLAAIEAKIGDVSDAEKTADELKTLKHDLDVTIKALDQLQIRIKSDRTAAPSQKKSFAEVLTEGVQENGDKIRNMKKGETVSFNLKAVVDMTFPTNFSTADASVAFVRPGIIELPKRKLHIRQLLQGGAMGNKSTFDYVKEIAGEGDPAPANEGAAKSQFDLDLQEISSPAEWIAGYVRISRNMLDDVTGMTSFLQSRLVEKLLRVEDEQILNGNGTRPNLSGITDAGNFTAATGGGTIDVEQLVFAIAQLEGYDREANGILLNPADWYRIWLTKSTGSVAGLYNLPVNVITKVGDQMFIAGVPVFRSTALAVDKFIVGDWVMGANLISREAARVEFFYEDGTNVRENKVTVRIEERVALPIYGDNYFIYGDFGNVS